MRIFDEIADFLVYNGIGIFLLMILIMMYFFDEINSIRGDEGSNVGMRIIEVFGIV